MRIFFLCLIFLALFFSCSEKSVFDKFNVPNYSEIIDIQFETLEMDSFSIDLARTSSVGMLKLINSRFVFFDKVFASAYLLDSNYNIEERRLGLGKGPNEIFSILWVENFADSSMVIMDMNGIIYVIDHEWKVQRRLQYQGGMFNGVDEAAWVEYAGKSIRQFGDEKILVQVSVDELPWMNSIGLFSTKAGDAHYRESPAVGEVCLQSGKTLATFASRPPVYSNKKKRYLCIYNFMDFVVRDSSYMVAWAVDSLIYHYQYPDSLMYSFGRAGKDMNTQYIPYRDIDDIKKYFYRDYEQFGYYTQLEFDKESGMLFRVYYKGSGKGNGLQIYNGSTLIADVEVPKDFKILGSLDGCFYGSGEPDEDNEIVMLYRFKIPGLCEN